MIVPSNKILDLALPDNQLRISQEDLRRRVSRIRYDLTTGELIPYPTLDSTQAVSTWAKNVEAELKGADIPEAQWSDAAILFLEDSRVNIEMRKMRERRLEKGQINWPWAEFKAALDKLLVERDSRSSIQKLREDHPAIVTAAGAGLVIAGGSVLGPALVVSGLNGVGFTPGGVAAASWATSIQSMVYGGATSGLFSVCQSIGATAVPASAGAVASAFGSVAAGVGLIKKGTNTSKTKNDNEDITSTSKPNTTGTDDPGSLPPPYNA